MPASLANRRFRCWPPGNRIIFRLPFGLHFFYCACILRSRYRCFSFSRRKPHVFLLYFPSFLCDAYVRHSAFRLLLLPSRERSTRSRCTKPPFWFLRTATSTCPESTATGMGTAAPTLGRWSRSEN